MGPAKGIKVLLLIIIVGILGSTFGVVRTAAVPFKMIQVEEVVLGSGSAGSGSLAVAALFSTSASTGAGAFSGNLGVPSGPVSGLFSLTVINPANAPVLPCPNGQVSASGNVVSGSFQGDQVLVAGCVGSGVPGVFVMFNPKEVGIDFSGSGTGTVAVFTEKIRTVSEFVAAGVTSSDRAGGAGTVYTAEADGITRDGTLFGGGAFTGAVSDISTGAVWQLNKVSIQPGCTLTTTGVTGSFGSFPNQLVSSSYTLVTCPPTSLGPQTARFVYAIGGDASPIYKGTGSALVEFFAHTLVNE